MASEHVGAPEQTEPAIVTKILTEPPKLHFWGGEWNEGGMHTDHVRLLVKHALLSAPPEQLKIVETGAGLSTAIFAAIGAERVVSVAPDAELFERIGAYLESVGVSRGALNSFADFSEEVLPALAAKHEGQFDVALIDGGHGWPTVFVDFCYLNKMLKPGGVLFVDDIQLHSVKELYDLLKQQPGFTLVEELNKLVVFRKEWTMRYLPDFGGQPYIMSKPLKRF